MPPHTMARLQSFRLEDVADWRSDSSSDEEYSDAMERQPSTGSLASVLTGGWSPRSTMHTARDRASQRPMTPDGAQADLDDEGSSSPSNVESDDTAPGAGPVASRQQTPGVVIPRLVLNHPTSLVADDIKPDTSIPEGGASSPISVSILAGSDEQVRVHLLVHPTDQTTATSGAVKPTDEAAKAPSQFISDSTVAVVPPAAGPVPQSTSHVEPASRDQSGSASLRDSSAFSNDVRAASDTGKSSSFRDMLLSGTGLKALFSSKKGAAAPAIPEQDMAAIAQAAASREPAVVGYAAVADSAPAPAASSLPNSARTEASLQPLPSYRDLGPALAMHTTCDAVDAPAASADPKVLDTPSKSTTDTPAAAGPASSEGEAGPAVVPKLNLGAADSDDLSAAPLAPAACDSPVVSQRTARAATARGVHAPVAETTGAISTVPSPKPEEAVDEDRVDGDDENDGLHTFVPPAGPSDVPAESPRRVAKRAYKTLSKLVGKMVPGYKPPYVSASISGPVDAEHAAAVDDQAGTGAGRAGASDKALDNAAPEQPMTEQHPEPKAETVSTVGQGAAPESMESVERVLDDILAAAVGSVEEATPTHQQAEEQMAVAYGAATAGIADSVRSEVKKRKAEAEVFPEDEGRWAPEQPAPKIYAASQGGASSSSLSLTGTVSTPVAAAAPAGQATEFYLPQPAPASDTHPEYPASTGGVPDAAPNTPVTVHGEDAGIVPAQQEAAVASDAVPEATVLPEVAEQAILSEEAAAVEVAEIPAMTQLVVPAAKAAAARSPKAEGSADHSVPVTTEVLATSPGVYAAAPRVVPEPSGPLPAEPEPADSTPATAPVVDTSAAYAATTSGSLNSSLGGAVVVEVHTLLQKPEEGDAKPQAQEEPSTKALVTAAPATQPVKPVATPAVAAPRSAQAPLNVKKAPRKSFLCSCLAPQVNV